MLKHFVPVYPIAIALGLLCICEAGLCLSAPVSLYVGSDTFYCALRTVVGAPLFCKHGGSPEACLLWRSVVFNVKEAGFQLLDETPDKENIGVFLSESCKHFSKDDSNVLPTIADRFAAVILRREGQSFAFKALAQLCRSNVHEIDDCAQVPVALARSVAAAGLGTHYWLNTTGGSPDWMNLASQVSNGELPCKVSSPSQKLEAHSNRGDVQMAVRIQCSGCWLMCWLTHSSYHKHVCVAHSNAIVKVRTRMPCML